MEIVQDLRVMVPEQEEDLETAAAAPGKAIPTTWTRAAWVVAFAGRARDAAWDAAGVAAASAGAGVQAAVAAEAGAWASGARGAGAGEQTRGARLDGKP